MTDADRAQTSLEEQARAKKCKKILFCSVHPTIQAETSHVPYGVLTSHFALAMIIKYSAREIV